MKTACGALLGMVAFWGTVAASAQDYAQKAAELQDMPAAQATDEAEPGDALPSGRWHAGEGNAFADTRVKAVDSRHVRIVDAKYLLVNGLHLGLAIADTEMTQHCIAEQRCREGNPLMPSSHAGQLAVDLGFVAYGSAMSYWLKKHKSTLWWLPAAGGAAAHTAGLATGLLHR